MVQKEIVIIVVFIVVTVNGDFYYDESRVFPLARKFFFERSRVYAFIYFRVQTTAMLTTMKNEAKLKSFFFSPRLQWEIQPSLKAPNI